MEVKKTSVLTRIKRLGPGAVIAASIVGPGTVTTASIAGINYKYALLWALLFSTIATIILQLMSSRLGIITGKSLAENIRSLFINNKFKLSLFTVIIIFAIGLGNSAYQGGNISGSIVGLSTMLGGSKFLWINIISLIVFAMLWIGSYNYIEKVMTFLVGLMILLFAATAIVVKPDIGEMLSGMFTPSIPKGALLTAMGLIGTTVVPHCIFLHSSITATKYKGEEINEALTQNTFDTIFNTIVVGIVTIAITVTGAAMFNMGMNVNSSLDLAKSLEPLVGTWAKYFFGLGIFAAGISSAAVAPMSAAYTICGILGWSTDLKDKKFRMIWIIVLATGYILSSTGLSPIQIILVAQTFNGILLPVTAVILLVAMNSKSLLNKFVNTRYQNFVGVLITSVTFFLGAKSLYTVVTKLLGL